MSAELTFIVRERLDRNGDTYLFGRTPFLDAIVFLRPSPHRPGLWHVTVKPWIGPKGGGQGEETDKWIEEALNDYDPSTKER